MSIVDALKKLYMKVTGSESEPKETQIAELINKLAEDYPADGGGETT